MWFKDDIDNTAYFSYSDGSFRLDENSRVASYATMLIKGPYSATATVTRSVTALAIAMIEPSLNLSLDICSGHYFCSVVPHKKIKIKVTKAIMTKSPRGKPEFNPTGQMYIELLDSTAATEHVLDNIQKKRGINHMLVTSDGLQLEDLQPPEVHS